MKKRSTPQKRYGQLPLLLILIASALIIVIAIVGGRDQRKLSSDLPASAEQSYIKKHIPFLKHKSLLERIKKDGELIVVTRNSPTTYYEGPEGPVGLEYDLAKAFADHLGVEVRFEIPQKFDDVLAVVEQGKAHIAAAGITVLDKRKKRVRFGPSYQEIRQQLVSHSDAKTPKAISAIEKGSLKVIKGSSHEHQLRKLRAAGELQIEWSSTTEYDPEELLYLVQERVLDYTISDSNEIAFNIRYFPKIRVAFDLSGPQKLAWALKKGSDDSLLKEVETFFEQARESGMIADLLTHYYGHVKRLNSNDIHAFWKNVNKRLPKYEPLFKKVGGETGYEWELLAAIGYQESHWNPAAVSPTGVKGLMMLTNAAAKHVNIENREDPEQSVIGAVRYLELLGKQLPEDIVMPDRLWFTLAGYNVGFGHLEDARVLTERLGGDPDSWYDVRKRLPLLGQKKWYSTVKHGYARGREPVKYVDNIRNYHELLRWYSSFRDIENSESSGVEGMQKAIVSTLAPATDKPRKH